MKQHCDLIIDQVNVASMQDNGQAYGAIENACVAIKGGEIVYVGQQEACRLQATKHIHAQDMWMTPGLIDCHTHLVYAGSRAPEFEQRLKGVSYEDIARAGGGIRSTVTATRAASAEALYVQSERRLKRLMEEGVTSVEIKSGYGLDLDTEIMMLETAKRLEDTHPISVRRTYLGAHTVPEEFHDNADGYIQFVCKKVLPEIAQRGLADAVDVFCEHIGFSPLQSERVIKKARELGLGVKMHAEQLSDSKGAVLASRYNALSVDHLEFLQEEDCASLAKSHTVAVLLPGAYYFLNEKQKPPVEALRKHRVPIAVASDLNPGSSPMASLLSAMNMACTLFGLTPEEALNGATRHAARALGLTHKGMIKVGLDADLCLWEIDHPSELAYGLNLLRPAHVFKAGEHV